MPCQWWNVKCHVGSATRQGIGAGVDALADAIRDSVAWMIENTTAWWVKVPSIDPATSGYTTVAQVAGLLHEITLAVAVGGMTAAGVRMAVTRKPDPLIGIGRGLAVIAGTGALGVIVPSLLIRAGDTFSTWVITRAAHTSDIGGRLALLMGLGAGVPAGVVVVLGLIAVLASFVQSLLMMFRQASVLILTGCLLLAASGQFVEATRPWFRRVTGWMLALICYKPAAALVYAAAFTMAGQGGSPTAMLAGFSMIILSVVALPVLVRLFTWATGAVAQAGGGGAAAISAAAYGLLAAGSLHQRGDHSDGPGGRGASGQAQFLSQQLGGRTTGGASATAAPTTVRPSAPTSATSIGSAASTGQAGTTGGAAGAGAAVRGVGQAVSTAQAATQAAASAGQEPEP
jgi:hypothetical protein